MQREKLSATIKSTVRQRIMMHTGDKDLVIYEGKLATEFGVSRTPVRQVIQSLAAEWMVEVRSGVGTIATPLLAERRVADMGAFSAILRACSETGSEAPVNLVLMEMSSLRMYLEQNHQSSPDELFFDVSNKFAEGLVGLVQDNILRDALVACYWRYLRRRLAEHQLDYRKATVELVKLIKDAEYGAQDGDAERVLRMISVGVEDIIKTSEPLENSA